MATIAQDGGTINISMGLISNTITYSGNNITGTISNFPITFINISSNPGSNLLTIQIINDLIFDGENVSTPNNFYFRVGTPYIKFNGYNSTNIATKITLQNIPNYNGFIQNGNSYMSGYSNITIHYLGIYVNNTDTITSLNINTTQYPGWLCQPYFTEASISYCYSNGPIGIFCGGLIGSYCGNITMDNCYTTGSLNYNSGGIFASNIISEDKTINISNCYVLGNNSVDGISFGGIFGSSPTYNNYNINISNCFTLINNPVSGSIFTSYPSGKISVLYCYGYRNICSSGQTQITSSTYYDFSSGWKDNIAINYLTNSSDWINFNNNTPWLLTSIQYFTPPIIYIQPTSQLVSIGDSFTLSFSVISPETLTYQWFFNENAISGANSATYTVNNSSAVNIGNYYVSVTNNTYKYLTSTSNIAIITVYSTITQNGTITMNSSNDIIFTSISGSPQILLFPVYLTNQNPSSSNQLIINLGSNLILSDSIYNYFNINSDYITLSGNNSEIPYTVTIQNTPNYAGLVKNFTNSSNIIIEYIGILVSSDDIVTTLNKYGGWIYQGNSYGINTIIQNCYSNGKINSFCGGIVGSNIQGLTIKNCYSTGTISSDGAGIGAYNLYIVNIENCYSTGNITTGCGIISGYATQFTITNCYSTGTISLNGGGIIKDLSTNLLSTIQNCFSLGIIDNTSAGICYSSTSGSLNIIDCYSIGYEGPSIVSTSLNNITITNCYGAGVSSISPPIDSDTYYNYNINQWSDSTAETYLMDSSSWTNNNNNTPWLLSSFSTTTPVNIYVQPQSQSVNLNSSVTLSVIANGTAPFKYQWYNPLSNAISGATNNTYIISSFEQVNVGNYYVIISNSFSSIQSLSAYIDILEVPIITLQPTSKIINIGDYFDFSADASGTYPLSWQWYLNNNPISSITNSSAITNFYNVYQSTSSDIGSYYAIVTNSNGSSTNIVTLSFYQAPSIITQPSSLTVNVDNSVTFTIIATGTPSPSYDWFYDGNTEPLQSGSLNTYQITSAQITDEGSYYVIVSNSVNPQVISNTFTLTVITTNTSPTITTNPQSVTTTTGNTATFTVSASGTPSLIYQWYLNNSIIVNANLSSYTTPVLNTTNSGNLYYVIVKNSYGSVTSESAILTVNIQIPTVTLLSLNSAPPNTIITISGTNFTSTSTVSFGDITSSKVNYINSTQLTALSPNSTGSVYVFVTNISGTSTNMSNINQYTYISVPNPPTNLLGIAGNKKITLSWTAPVNTGGSIISSYTVNLSGNNGNTYSQITSGTSLTILNLTNNISYTFKVYATNEVGNSSSASYSQPIIPRNLPTISSTSQLYSSVLGGDNIIVTGTNLYNVKFYIASINSIISSYSIDNTSFTATIPAYNIGGTYNITIVATGGTTIIPNCFTYYNSPNVNSFSPIIGQYVGGTNITISGSYFSSVSNVYLMDNLSNKIPANIKNNTDSQIVITLPSGTNGIQSSNIYVTTLGGTSNSSELFNYISTPSINSTSLSSPTVLIINGNYLLNSIITVNGISFSTTGGNNTQITVSNGTYIFTINDTITVNTAGGIITFKLGSINTTYNYIFNEVSGIST